jgi:signal transduction histidine kinase/DNA-binding response OmpR family regulator
MLVYISSLIYSVMDDSPESNIPQAKVKIVNAAMLDLYEYETGVLHVVATGNPEEHRWRLSDRLSNVLQRLEELRSLSPDSSQDTEIDAVRELLFQKDKNTDALLSIRKEMDELHARSFDQEMRASRKPVKVPETVTIKDNRSTDTLVIQRQQKGFFKRLAEVFTPVKGDTAMRVTTTQTLSADTLMNEYDPNKAISEAMSSLQRTIAIRRDNLNARLNAQSASLLRKNDSLTVEIRTILNYIQYEEGEGEAAAAAARQQTFDRRITELSAFAIACPFAIIIFLIIILIEISKARRLRRQREEARHKAEQLLAGREQLMLMISHDVRAPLSSILSSTGIMRYRHPDREQAILMDNIETSARHTLALVDGLLDNHSLESGKMHINLTPFSLPELLEEIHSRYKPLADSKSLRLTLNIENEENMDTYMGDTLRISQAISNLLSNAIKFTDKGEVSIRASITPNHPTLIHIYIKDSGPGIAAEDQQTIFEEFARLEETRTVKGFGLGLSISARLITLMNGHITLESEPGQGATFAIHLPLHTAPTTEEPTQETNTHTTHTHPEKYRTLRCIIIDDDPIQLKYITALMQYNGINASGYQSPEHLPHLLTSTQCDFILTDMQIPGIHGKEILALIRSTDKGAQLPVIAISAGKEHNEEYYTSAGFAAFLIKPLTEDDLLTVLNRIIPPAARTIHDRIDFTPLTAFADTPDEEKTIIDTFLAHASRSADALADALEANDRATARSIAHRLLPTVTLVNLATLTTLLTRLEQNTPETTSHDWKSIARTAINHLHTLPQDAPPVE